MFYIVFSDKDKDKMLKKGFNFIKNIECGDIMGYMFAESNNVNFEQDDMKDIKYVKTNTIAL